MNPLEHIFKFQTRAFEKAVRDERHEEALTIARTREIDQGRAKEAVMRAFNETLQAGRFGEAVSMGQKYGLTNDCLKRAKAMAVTSGENADEQYASALARRDYDDAWIWACDRLSLLAHPHQTQHLELLLRAASLYTNKMQSLLPTHLRSWKPYCPGDGKFVCIPDTCDAKCCSRFDLSVDISRQDAGLLQRASKTDPQIRHACSCTSLPKNENGRCVFLTAGKRCGVYDFRPDACVQYPFKIGFFELRESNNLFFVAPGECSGIKLKEGGNLFCGLQNTGSIVPLIFHDLECPGFKNERITVAEYAVLAARLVGMNVCYDFGIVCDRHQ